jgi:hypothetical protein
MVMVMVLNATFNNISVDVVAVLPVITFPGK